VLTLLKTLKRSVASSPISILFKKDELKKLHKETEAEIEELIPNILDRAFKGGL